ncbi:MAG TPA: hypothetical protein VGM24_04155, partial [Puia sp.]
MLKRCIRWSCLIGTGFFLICQSLFIPDAALGKEPLPPQISIVTDSLAGGCARQGLKKLTEILATRNISFEEVGSPEQAKGRMILVTGLAYDGSIASGLLRAGQHTVDRAPEALTVWKTQWVNKKVIVISGYDETGLMYALTDVARQIRQNASSGDPLKEVQEITEAPAIRDRAVSMYTMNRAYWESRFYDEKYWGQYLDMLSENRFNSLVIVFGYENGGFLAPCYPYFFNVDEFPDVKMVGLSAEQQNKNLLAMNRLICMAHERGIRVTAGIWDHIYRGGVQGGGMPGTEKAPDEPVAGLVWGLSANNLTAYTKAALEKFIREIPVDGIQFRLHGESGLRKEEEASFWDDVFRMIKTVKPDLLVDLRAKELPPTAIPSAESAGIKFRIDTKFWMEQMGLPYHPTRINPDPSYLRHSYGDLLRYPKKYDMNWRLWTGGTSRILLWGDPDYARRFMESVHLYDGSSYDVNEPLATKMEAQPEGIPPFDLLQPQHRYYTYEFERYWHFFQVFGRLGYDPQASAAIWDKELALRFGKKTGPLVESALHKASAILPRIIASCYPYGAFPATRGWAEKQHLGDLPYYAKAEGSDLCQFANFDEEARLLLEGAGTAKIRPSANCQWFAKKAKDIRALVLQIKGQSPDRRKELNSTITDLEILANLALYHSERIPAAVYYRLFVRTEDVAALDSAIAYEKKATEAWRKIVSSAGDYYDYNLRMGVSVAGLSGHWRDEL